MWKTVYAGIVIVSVVVTVVYGWMSLVAEHYGYAIGYTALLLFGATTMWLVGAGIFNGGESKDKKS